MLTLKILAGAKYLDMIWYHISVDHVQGYVHDCLLAVNSFKVSQTDAEWRAESEKFLEVLKCKHGSIGNKMLEE
jgi:hypothetical protein